MAYFISPVRIGAAVLGLCALAAVGQEPASRPATAPAMSTYPKPPGPGKLKAVQIGSRVDVTIGGVYFTSYRWSPEEKYPFFFPVNGPSGISVTSMRNGEFPHHSSLYLACDMVNGGNYWQELNARGQILASETLVEKDSGDEVILTQKCQWKRAEGQPFNDQRRITIRVPKPTLRQIDFDITLEAMEDVEIKKTNHSFFSTRMDPDLTPRLGGTMVNAQGDLAQAGTFGKPSPWLACYGTRHNVLTEGLAILQHPENPGFPSPWFTRDYGFFSPTGMFWPADGKSTHFAKGEKLHLRYRVLVFSGDVKEAGIAEAFTAYAAEK